MGNPRSASILAVSDRGGFYSWEFLLDGNPSSSSILAVSDRGGFYSWEFLLDGNFSKLQRVQKSATTIISHPALQTMDFPIRNLACRCCSDQSAIGTVPQAIAKMAAFYFAYH